MVPVRNSDNFLVFGAPALGEAEKAEVISSLDSGWLGTGPKVARFEDDFASYKGVESAVAVSSCTAALHLSMVAAGVGPGDEVITTPLTFCATVNAIIHTGATPVLADVDLSTMNIDPDRIRDRIGDRTRAIIPVHFAGRSCDMHTISEIAEANELKVIEDCAHAIETECAGAKAGTIGDFGCFSFYVTKSVVTGEGGMVLARRQEDAERIKVLALHGMSKDAWRRFGDDGYKHYDVVECGYKYNMMDLQAALGIHQLKRVEESWQRRKEIWERYNEAFAGLPVETPRTSDQRLATSRHAYHLYTVLVGNGEESAPRDKFLASMTANNIGVGVHYRAIPEHPYYSERFGWKPDDYPNAMRIGRSTVSLPLSAGLSDSDVDDVIEAVKRSCDSVG